MSSSNINWKNNKQDFITIYDKKEEEEESVSVPEWGTILEVWLSKTNGWFTWLATVHVGW